MASTPGRVLRIAAGVTLAALAVLQGGFYLLLLAPAALFITTVTMNYCPMGLFYGQGVRSGELLEKLQKYDLK